MLQLLQISFDNSLLRAGEGLLSVNSLRNRLKDTTPQKIISQLYCAIILYNYNIPSKQINMSYYGAGTGGGYGGSSYGGGGGYGGGGSSSYGGEYLPHKTILFLSLGEN